MLRPGGRRRSFRRVGEEVNRYTDHLATSVVTLALVILLSSILDAAFTLLHLAQGASEINPIMEMALGEGVTYFLAAKTWFTGLGVAFLAAHQNFRVSRLALYFICTLYLALLVYHATLFIYWH